MFQGALLKNGGKKRDWFFFKNDSSDEFVSFLGYGDLPKFTLSVFLCSNKDYQAKTAWDYTFREAYEYTNWHVFTGFGDWLNTTRQGPRDQSKGYQGQPVGQCF